MDQNKINEMAETIMAANAKTREEVVAALNAYWAGKMAVVWNRSDVLGRAWARGMLLTNEQVDHLLGDLLRHHDPELGFTWTTIEWALDEAEPLDIRKIDLETLVDYPGDFRVWWNNDEATKVFNTDEGRNLHQALAFAAIKAAKAKSEVMVCVVDEAGNNYPIVTYEAINGRIMFENPRE